MNRYGAIIKQEGDWWIGWVEDFPGVNCQERTRDELLATLRITLKEALEMNKQAARSEAGSDFAEVILQV